MVCLDSLENSASLSIIVMKPTVIVMVDVMMVVQCVIVMMGLAEIIENKDHCRNIACSGNGVCMNWLARFTCLCAPDYTGGSCDVEIDDCMRVECANGKCVDGIASFECLCEAGYTGDLCGVDIVIQSTVVAMESAGMI